jgi:hypothetical protein
MKILIHVLILRISEQLRSHVAELTGKMSATCNNLYKFDINRCCIDI